MARKHDPKFIELVKTQIKANLDGSLKLGNIYVSLAVNIGWKGEIVVIPYSHLVWLLTFGVWPKDGMVLDHINDDPLDNRPVNLKEITQEENQKKRRGRKTYRSYGSGKYGHGLTVFHDKRDGRFYLSQYRPRSEGKGDLKSIKKSLGGFGTLAEVKRYISKNFPGPVGPNTA